MEKLFVSLVYKYVMMTLMLADANYALEKLEIPGGAPITMAHVTSSNVTPPRMRAGGSLDTSNMIFGFGDNRLQFIQFTGPDSELPLHERQLRWARMKSLVDTNEAYQLATNWLNKLDVDVPALEKAHPVTVVQQFYFSNGDANQKVMLPQFDVRWGTNRVRPAVWVSVFGPTKTPLHIRQEDGSFIRRPKLIKAEEIEHLLSISDQEFMKWTTQEKSNIVVQAAGNTYANLEFPEIASIAEKRKLKPTLPFAPSGKKENVPQKKTKTVLPATP